MNILQTIIEHKKYEVIAQKKALTFDESELKDCCLLLNETNSLIKRLDALNDDYFALIAEVKKASPSKGIIKENFDPLDIATQYEKAGADAISVLTDEKFFMGSIENLDIVKKNINLPILRKDFIIDEFQIFQTRLINADIILLIAAALSPTQLKDYYLTAKEIGLDVLIEVHNAAEMDLALETGAKLIGINNRNLETFEVSLDTTLNLIKDIDKNERYIISESGIKDNNDIKLLKEKGVKGVLVGENLVKHDNIETAVKNLLKDSR